MAFEDSLIGNNDFDPRTATEDLIRHVSDQPLPSTLDIRDLNTRLARKINAPLKSTAPEKSKPPLDLSGFEEADADTAPVASSENQPLDISGCDSPDAPPPPVVQPPLEAGAQTVAGVKGLEIIESVLFHDMLLVFAAW